MEGEGQLNGVVTATQDESTGVRGTRPSLLSLLVEAGVAPEEELRAAATAGLGAGEKLGEVVIKHGWIDEAGLGRLLARQWSLQFLADDGVTGDAGRAEVLPLERAEALGAALIAAYSGVPCAAVAEPTTARLDELRQLLGPDASFVIVTPATLERLLAERREPGEDANQLDSLLADLASATGKLTTFRERIAALEAGKLTAEAELASIRARLAAAEQALAEERERSRSLRTKLATLIDELDA